MLESLKHLQEKGISMCIFCAVATQNLRPTEALEAANLVEEMGWAAGIFFWLFILYQGYQRTKKETNSFNKALLISHSPPIVGFSKSTPKLRPSE